MLIRVAVADSNSVFLSRFVSAMEQNPGLVISTYTDSELLRADVLKKKMDVLLFDPSVYACDYEISNQIVSVLFFDDSVDLPNKYSEFARINKYQRVSDTYRTVLDLYSNLIGKRGNVLGYNKAVSVAVYSPIGGAGCTSVSLAFAEYLASLGRRTFYISFEDFASESFYLEQSGEHGMSDLLELLGENVDIKLKLQAYVQCKSDNFFYLRHFDTPRDLNMLGENEILELLNSITESDLFDFVVIDLPTSVNEIVQTVFSLADHIFVVEKNDELSAIKMKAFFGLKYLVNECLPKIRRIINFSVGRPSRLTSPRVAAVVQVVQNPLPDSMVKLIATNNMKDAVRELV